LAESAATVSAPAGRREGLLGILRREIRDPDRRTAYLMVLPMTAIIVLIAVFPILYAVYLSFFRIEQLQPTEFVGIDNYVTMFQDPDFRQAFLNTVIFTVISVTFEFAFGLGIALALNRIFLARGAVRAISLVPWAFPTVISAVMWRLMYQDRVGVMAYIADRVLGYTGNILSSDSALLVGAIAVDVWKTTPFVAILLLAGLQVIPHEVYEASRVDGASPMQQFWRITLPLLKPAILVALLFRTLDAWRIYDLFWGMAQQQLTSLSTYVYESVRISQLKVSVGNAAAIFIFLSSIFIAFLYVKVLGARTTE
jgi:trehalose/maltose transport system permease protein